MRGIVKVKAETQFIYKDDWGSAFLWLEKILKDLLETNLRQRGISRSKSQKV
ncbi:hypothetical protein UNSWDHB_1630 [Dehalobacter sp. UNSWDHB]|nr:hypothetical protein DHBDCA_p2243 [Dehalobacter sp. DCA]AFV06256.1 hypothetical protein DCF50_p2253 [Dehalobacter sp. CF]EQB21006.1 hypothetical protein UNSWDHB_1630 [Dehalobacter sp. UNSWDHB]